MGFDLGGLLSQLTNGAGAKEATPDQYQQVAQSASPDLLSHGLSEMFRSDQTPPFGQMTAQMFGDANPNQQAGMLNELLRSLGPSVLASLAGGAGGGALGSIIASLQRGGGGAAVPTITPDQASTITPDQVKEIANHAEQHNPNVIDSMGGFFAQHSGLIKTLGSAALTIALAKMAERHNG
jgi:hypothetical protein